MWRCKSIALRNGILKESRRGLEPVFRRHLGPRPGALFELLAGQTPEEM